MRKQPRFLVCQTVVLSTRWHGDDRPVEERTQESWFTLETEKQLAELPNYEKCGFGQDYESVTYRVQEITRTSPVSDFTITPTTVKDEALRFRSEGGVDIGLRGKGWDPKSVYWDTRGNSFAVVTPLPDHERIVSEQGVVLCSINGIGEVRWTVYGPAARYAENAEAVDHFGLSWKS